MSEAFPHRQILRCPLCTIAARPIHLTHGAMRCENCGNTFRVVHAQGKRTGKSLATELKKSYPWERGANEAS